ncbi:Hypothetical predicted protein [Paramuricea clavata]|nr:Hypothetical predicted protein [Paramuricea clavata]CAB4019279.1 Hypothetical predicted protein [Paramuricea clavata]
MEEKYEDELASLPWVQDFYIGVASEPEKSWQLYITCAYNKVPSMADLKKIFGVQISYFVDFIQESIDEDSKRSKESLPCPSYLRGPISGDELCVQEGSRREWFETNIFDESWGMKDKYWDELVSLPWVQDFYIGVASEPEKSWQVYITCAHNKVPSMADLKKIFGVDISCFVEFIQKSIEDSKRSKESLPCPSYLRGPISGDELCVQEVKKVKVDMEQSAS